MSLVCLRSENVCGLAAILQ